MKRFIKHLQKQPREVKSQAAFIGAVGVTALVAFVWVTTLPARFSSVASGVDVENNVAALAESVKSELPELPVEEPSEAEVLKNRVDTMIEDIRRNKEKKNAGSATAQDPAPAATATPIRIETVSATPTPATTTAPATSRPIRIEVR